MQIRAPDTAPLLVVPTWLAPNLIGREGEELIAVTPLPLVEMPAQQIDRNVANRQIERSQPLIVPEEAEQRPRQDQRCHLVHDATLRDRYAASKHAIG